MIPEVVTARATWLFVKGERETVRLTVRHVDASYELSVAGPAHYRVSYQFADAMLLMSVAVVFVVTARVYRK